MSKLLSGLLGVFLSTNQPTAVSNLVKETTGASVSVANPNDPVDVEYRKILADDDAARAEVDKWIRDAQSFDEQGAASPRDTLKARIKERLAPVQKAYEDFLERNPKHVDARVAYASFLTETGDEWEGKEQLEKARELKPDDPAIWNNLANYYGHRSPVKKAFEYYAKAIELNPNEPVYYQNFATTVYLFRKDAMEFYNIDEKQVFDKALDLYRQAMKLDPTNFVLATDYAQSFYGTKPPRFEEGLKAWQDTYGLARDDIERQGIVVHLARCEMHIGKFDEAAKHLTSLTNSMYTDMRQKLQKRLEELKAENSPANDSKK